MSSRPDPGDLSPTSKRVLDALSAQSSLAWPILKTQCELASRDPALLKPEDLANLVPRLREALARFTNPSKGLAFERDLQGDHGSAANERQAVLHSGFSAPSGLGEVAHEVLRALSVYTPLAWPIIEVTCGKAQIIPATLNHAELEALIPAFAKSVARFTTPQKAQAAEADLRRLLPR
jgi:hypothetical protein